MPASKSAKPVQPASKAVAKTEKKAPSVSAPKSKATLLKEAADALLAAAEAPAKKKAGRPAKAAADESAAPAKATTGAKRSPALPDLPIIDPHHHLWDRPGWQYMVHDLLADITLNTANATIICPVLPDEDDKITRELWASGRSSQQCTLVIQGLRPAPKVSGLTLGYKQANTQAPQLKFHANFRRLERIVSSRVKVISQGGNNYRLIPTRLNLSY